MDSKVCRLALLLGIYLHPDGGFVVFHTSLSRESHRSRETLEEPVREEFMNWIWKWNIAFPWHSIDSIYSLLVSVKMLVAQSCPTLCDPMDSSLVGASVHEILQVRILKWVAIPFSRGSSWPRDWTWISWTAGRSFSIQARREAHSLQGRLLYVA